MDSSSGRGKKGASYEGNLYTCSFAYRIFSYLRSLEFSCHEMLAVIFCFCSGIGTYLIVPKWITAPLASAPPLTRMLVLPCEFAVPPGRGPFCFQDLRFVRFTFQSRLFDIRSGPAVPAPVGCGFHVVLPAHGTDCHASTAFLVAHETHWDTMRLKIEIFGCAVRLIGDVMGEYCGLSAPIADRMISQERGFCGDPLRGCPEFP
jgi:hypothetical protein